MAKTSGALFSTDATGSVGGITYQHAYRSRTCRGKPHPLNRKSTSQIAVRAMVTKAIQYWQALIEIQSILWEGYTDGNGNTGYHSFMSKWIKRGLAGLPQYKLPPDIGYCLVNEYLVGELTVGGACQDP